ncbi:hypothetical protein [Thalassomonas sp. M1454]|uniref:hypothetical protein n=1 Tax=Thalassomonas sp. M1454 TaxID=2594477 RepID=UPI00117DCBF7|nr:hypothetical protein [Thalassomonas sp. M1454]TRX54953.1 hypothetical protein FNN08_10130 [Thalassomonas sp. M1454]
MAVNLFYIGVTGHRDLNDKTSEQLTKKINSFITDINSQLVNTPVSIITGMADGADRILAKVALANNLPVQIVLPMPEEMYKADFSEESWAEYQLIKSNHLVTCLTVNTENIDLEAAQEQGDERNKLYHALGKYLVEQSNMMVAVWDGENTGFKGGTCDVVLSYLKAKKVSTDIELCKIKFSDENTQLIRGINSVYWLKVSAGSENHHQIEGGSLSSYFLTGSQGPYSLVTNSVMPTFIADSLDELDAYNKRCKELGEQGEISSQYSLLNGYNKDSEFEHLKAIDEEFLKADAVALSHQKKSDGQFKLFSFMAAVMGLLFLVYAKIVASKLLLIGYLLFFVFGWIFFKISTKNKNFTRHLSARILAETIRTQFYLALINKSSNKQNTKLMDLSGVSQFSSASWLGHIFKNLKLNEQSESKDTTQESMEFVCKHWLEDQLQYFRNKTQKLSAHHHKLEKIKSALFITSAIATLALIFFKYQLVDIVLFAHVDAKTFTVLLMGLLPFWLGVWEIYQSKMAVKELLWQYRNQSMVFEQAHQEILNTNTQEQKVDVLVNLAERSMMENYIWIIHRYHREQEPPTAG